MKQVEAPTTRKQVEPPVKAKDLAKKPAEVSEKKETKLEVKKQEIKQN